MKPKIARDCSIDDARGWRSRIHRPITLLLLTMVLTVSIFTTSGFAVPPSGEADDPSQTTINKRPGPDEYEDNQIQPAEPADLRTILAYAFLPAILIAFLAGQNSGRHAPSQTSILTAINNVFIEQRRRGATYNFAHLGPVLTEAENAVIDALRKLKLL